MEHVRRDAGSNPPPDEHLLGTAREAHHVRAFILKPPEHIQERGSWQHAAELMIHAGERGGSIEAATTQIEDALFLGARFAHQ
jgi:hypothetical protein